MEKNIAKSKRVLARWWPVPSQALLVNVKKEYYTKFTDNERKRLFCLFWELGDKAVQDPYFHGLMHVKTIGRCRPRKCEFSSPREATYMYVVSNNTSKINTIRSLEV